MEGGEVMANYLSEEKLAERRAEIIRLAKGGMPRRQISKEVRCVDTFVKETLDDAGIPINRKTNKTRGQREHMWTKTGDNLRHAIAAKARRAAREQLKKLSVLGDG